MEVDFKPSLTFLESNFQLDEQICMLEIAFSNSNSDLILKQISTILSFLEVREWDPKNIAKSNILPSSIIYIKENSNNLVDTPTKKEILSFLCFISQKSQEISLFLIKHNIFNEFRELLYYTKDNFTSINVSKLFYNIVNHGINFAKLSIENNSINIAREAIFYFSNTSYGYIYTLYMNNIMKFINLLLSYELEIDDSLILSLSNSFVPILSQIICLQLSNVKKNILDNYIDFVSESADFVSNVSQHYQEYGNALFESRIISILNNQLSTQLMNKAWKSILNSDLALLEALPEHSDELTETQNQINPDIIFHILINNIKAEWSSSALHIFSIIISKDDSIFETYDFSYLYELIIANYNDLLFLPRREVMRLSFTILLKPNQLDFLDLLIEKELFQNFAVVLNNVPDDLIILSIQALNSSLDISSWVPLKYSLVKAILIDEYIELLEEWSENEENDLIANLSTSLLERISE